MNITKEQAEAIRSIAKTTAITTLRGAFVGLAIGGEDFDIPTVRALLRLGLCVVESGVTAEDCGHASAACTAAKRFDSRYRAGLVSEAKRKRAVVMLGALATELEASR